MMVAEKAGRNSHMLILKDQYFGFNIQSFYVMKSYVNYDLSLW